LFFGRGTGCHPSIRAVEVFVCEDAFVAAIRLDSTRRRSVHLVVFCLMFDSTSAVCLADGDGAFPGDRSFLAATLRDLSARISAGGAVVRCQRIPSHNKVSTRWLHYACADESLCRTLNKAADKSATVVLRAQHGTPRDLYDLDRGASLDWTCAALEVVWGNFSSYLAFVHAGIVGAPGDSR
jgi:hypothetical protein